ncbi:MAG: [LysW]-aminoadipate kinase [Candidatus Roizmanbacteria bacterium]|nr:[LysW]-aminoadipate kinase [Candidatus Roizmanbacteria bacterium]
MLVIKVGGGKQMRWDYVCEDLKARIDTGEKIIVVHGASEVRDEIAEKMGLSTKTVLSPSGFSSVYTDKDALDIFLMAYCGVVNKKIVAQMQSYGINAVGLSGVDGKLWQAKAKPNLMIKEEGKTKLIRDNLTGRVEKINTKLLHVLVQNDFVPVISAPAISFENEIVNTDNDWATAVTAGSLQAKEIIYLFEAEGLLKNFSDKSSVIGHIDKNNIDEFMNSAEGRMKKKLLGVKKAFELGVEKIYFGDGRIKNPIKSALEGKGTIIY